uniref:Asparagine synthase (Glutamine-hydrolyzing) n=1 Tax=Ganoderma boninense TaxID=34458 RepID=A0A5K1K463_9APHY|nr:Asparagine synthase (Glutamine-hydrolyzing) [Ganoderma boninense]
MHPIHDPPVLVDDLIPIILESDDHWWPRDFQRLALISPAWLSPVRKRLYATPSLRSFRACNLFARTLTENPTLLPYLHGLELRPIADRRRALGEEEMRSLRYILGLNGLQSITLGGDLAISAERFLHFMGHTPTVTTLHIDGYVAPDDRASSAVHRLPSLEWDDVIAFRFPYLRTLTLSNVALTIYPSASECPGTLSHLTLNNVDIIDGVLPDLCQGASETLRVLKVVGTSTVHLDDHILSMLEFCHNLQELHYTAVDKYIHPSIFDSEDTPTSPNLQALHMSGFDVNPQTLHAIAQVFPNLVDFAVLGRIIRVPPEEWKLFVESGKLPHLRRLVTTAGTNVPPFAFWTLDQITPLQDACRSYGVDLDCGPHPGRVL